MKVRCIDNGKGFIDITAGKEYEVLEIGEEYFKIPNDNNGLSLVYKSRFEEVKEMEYTKKELIKAFINGELKEGQEFRNMHFIDIYVKSNGLFWENKETVGLDNLDSDIKFKLRERWHKCTWPEAAQKKAEGKVLKCEVVDDKPILYNQSYCFCDKGGYGVSKNEMLNGQWYYKD